jgi:hypothetical protein
MHELSQYLLVDTPLGRGQAILIENAGQEVFWTVILNDNGAFVTFKQEKIRAARNYSLGRYMSDQEMKDIVKK